MTASLARDGAECGRILEAVRMERGPVCGYTDGDALYYRHIDGNAIPMATRYIIDITNGDALPMVTLNTSMATLWIFRWLHGVWIYRWRRSGREREQARAKLLKWP